MVKFGYFRDTQKVEDICVTVSKIKVFGDTKRIRIFVSQWASFKIFCGICPKFNNECY